MLIAPSKIKNADWYLLLGRKYIFGMFPFISCSRVTQHEIRSCLLEADDLLESIGNNTSSAKYLYIVHLIFKIDSWRIRYDYYDVYISINNESVVNIGIITRKGAW